MKYTAEAPMNLLDALVKLAPDSSKTTLRSWIKEGRVTVDDYVIMGGACLLTKGQTVAISPKKRFIGGGIEILYEDQDLVVIEKPSGLLSVATASETEKTAHSFLKDKYKKVFVVHRLDKDTSGVMMFALSEIAAEQLNALFERHALGRSYTGVVEGKVSQPTGTWESYLFEDKQFVVHSSPRPGLGSVLAKTHFKVIRVSKKYSLMEFTLETGKKNQIRVHCYEAGHSLVGDKKYGAMADPIKRLCLHAHHLSFKHPINGRLMVFNSPVPKEFARISQ